MHRYIYISNDSIETSSYMIFFLNKKEKNNVRVLIE